jgi:ribosomal protein S12 methylthiotransferase accessory factor YcaO
MIKKENTREECKAIMEALETYSEESRHLALFMIDGNVLIPYIQEILNIGNEKLSDILKEARVSAGFFGDNNHLQWESSVTEVDWERVDAEWEAKYEKLDREPEKIDSTLQGDKTSKG